MVREERRWNTCISADLVTQSDRSTFVVDLLEIPMKERVPGHFAVDVTYSTAENRVRTARLHGERLESLSYALFCEMCF